MNEIKSKYRRFGLMSRADTEYMCRKAVLARFAEKAVNDQHFYFRIEIKWQPESDAEFSESCEMTLYYEDLGNTDSDLAGAVDRAVYYKEAHKNHVYIKKISDLKKYHMEVSDILE